MGSYEKHLRRGHPITFGLLVFFGILEGSISTWLTVQYNNNNPTPDPAIRDRTRLLVGASWYTVLGSIVLALVFWRASHNVVASVASHIIFLSIAWLLWTAGAASITAALGGGNNCGKTDLIYCNQLNAIEAFGWASWIMTTVALIIVLLVGVRAMRHGGSGRDALI